MRNLLIMQENEFSGTISMCPSTMQPLSTYVANSSQVISKYVSQPHILVYMLNIATLVPNMPRGRTSPVSPTSKNENFEYSYPLSERPINKKNPELMHMHPFG